MFLRNLHVPVFPKKRCWWSTTAIPLKKFVYFLFINTYVRKLQSFRWKPIVVADLLKGFLSLEWMDASIIINKPLSEIHEVYHGRSSYVRTCPTYLHPWTLLIENHHSIYAATDSRIYDYIPFPIDESKRLDTYAVTVQLIFATKHVRENVLRYWILCALQEECMDPSGTILQRRLRGNKFINKLLTVIDKISQQLISYWLGLIISISTRYHFKDLNDALYIAKTDKMQ